MKALEGPGGCIYKVERRGPTLLNDVVAGYY